MSKMFMPIKFNTTIILMPNELNKSFEDTILQKIKSTLENSCSKHGYIKKDSIKVIKRSPGYIKEAHFNGNIAYDLNCIAEICNPAQDSIVKCVVKAKNNLGLLAIGKYEDMAILEVIIPKITSGILSDVNIDSINIGEEINVIVCGKKFTLYDKMISIIGRIIKDKKDDDISVIEEDEDDSPSIDDEEEDNLSFADDDLIDDNDVYEEDDDEETDNVRSILIDDEEDSKPLKGGEFNIFENDEEEEEDLDEELDELDEDDALDEEFDDTGSYGGEDYE
uniref:S1 motif domain-containing protein n=1 Tax=viral metagenome TaxID=1070528 RepID=A0A6C0I9C8_9ZZZZ